MRRQGHWKQRGEQYPDSVCVQNWLADLDPSSHRSVLSHFRRFFQSQKEFGSPDDMIEFVQAGATKNINHMLDLKKHYINSLKGRESNKRNANKYIRSFFSHNRAVLPQDTTINFRAEAPPIQMNLRAEHIRDIVHKSNALYRAVFLTMFQSGMGESEIVRFSNKDLENVRKAIRENAEIIKVNIDGRKSQKNKYSYFVLISGDALTALKTYMVERDSGPFKDRKAVYLTQLGSPLTSPTIYAYYLDRSQETGIRLQSYDGVHPHNMRDVMRTLWRKSGIPVEYAEFHMGHRHAFDDLGYDQIAKVYPEDIEDMYRKALPYLNLLSSGKPYGLVNRSEIERTVQESQQQQLDTIEQLRKANDSMAEKYEFLFNNITGIKTGKVKIPENMKPKHNAKLSVAYGPPSKEYVEKQEKKKAEKAKKTSIR